MNNAILTKDNMIKRRWLEAPLAIETVPHLLFQCSIAKAVWASLPIVLVLITFLDQLNNVGRGVRIGTGW